MYLLVFGILLNVLGIIFGLEAEAIILGLVNISLDAYLFICLYSLICQIQEENSRGKMSAV